MSAQPSTVSFPSRGSWPRVGERQALAGCRRAESRPGRDRVRSDSGRAQPRARGTAGSVKPRRPRRARGGVLVAYVSGHGFGHWTRSEAVLARVRGGRRRPRAHERPRPGPGPQGDLGASVSEVSAGPGVVQQGAARGRPRRDRARARGPPRALRRSARARPIVLRALGAASSTATFRRSPSRPRALPGCPRSVSATSPGAGSTSHYAAARPSFARSPVSSSRAPRRSAGAPPRAPVLGWLRALPRGRATSLSSRASRRGAGPRRERSSRCPGRAAARRPAPFGGFGDASTSRGPPGRTRVPLRRLLAAARARRRTWPRSPTTTTCRTRTSSSGPTRSSEARLRDRRRGDRRRAVPTCSRRAATSASSRSSSARSRSTCRTPA